ncbi:MAG: hypothetical protein A2V98_26255 [Planctomycetes bacterium RBG_16_64_12]|nr:MAG: hypothetical protein A2V98_26255 [Planctomycetes bacterium RBG_16_64_12]
MNPPGAQRAWRIARVAVIGLLLAVSVSCTRAHYRRRADREVYGLIDCASTDPRWPLDHYTIEPDPRSRFFDAYAADCPPMPPDDPTSHQLMHCVDGKRGWGWDRHYGRTENVESPAWRALLESYLPHDDDGAIVLDRQAAVTASLLHSREYQQALEDLYLSALDVSLERFRFDTQFFGGNSTFFTSDGRVRGGGDSKSTLNTDTDLSMRRFFASGGDLVVNMANELVWQFSGPDDYSGFTLLDFALVQPLLRAGGREVVLEGLTDSERALLANIRQMERFRRGFYAEIITGRNAGPGPARGGVGFSGVSSGAPGGPGGFLGLQEEQLRIRNQEANVDALQRNLDRLQAFYVGGRAKRFQVDQIRQQFYDAYGTLLSIEAGYKTRLDTYKVTLGLPPDLNVKIQDAIQDPQLSRFELIDPAMQVTENEIHDLWLRLIQPQGNGTDQAEGEAEGAITLEAVQEQLPSIRVHCLARMEELRRDRADLEEVLPNRRENLQGLFPPGGLRLTADKAEAFDLSPSLGEEALIERVTSMDNDYYARTSAFLGLTLLLAEESRTVSPADWDPGTKQASEKLLKLNTLMSLTAMLSGSRLSFPLDSAGNANQADAERHRKNLSLLKLPIIELMIYSARRSRIALTMEIYEERLGLALPEDWDKVSEALSKLREPDPRMDLWKSLEQEEGLFKTARTNLSNNLLAKSLSPPLDAATDESLEKLAQSLLTLMKDSPDYLAPSAAAPDAHQRLRVQTAALLDELSSVPRLVAQDPVADPEPAELMKTLMQTVAFHFSTVPLLQARIRLERAMLEPVNVEAGEALAIARENRRDWMNARAALVDAWRQIEVTADELESDLDVTFSGDLGTTNERPFRFRSTNGRLRVGLEFDAPLTRLAERNTYREVLIRYQQARREYYAIEDRINQSLRETFRTIGLNRQNFEVSRRAVGVSIDQVDEAQQRMLTPPKPGQTSQFGDTLAQDLVRALTDLLRAQNSFLGVWVDQEVQRLSLDLDLGTMELDARGMWIPSEHVQGEPSGSPDAGEGTPFVPEPLPLPLPELQFDARSAPSGKSRRTDTTRALSRG